MCPFNKILSLFLFFEDSFCINLEITVFISREESGSPHRFDHSLSYLFYIFLKLIFFPNFFCRLKSLNEVQNPAVKEVVRVIHGAL